MQIRAIIGGFLTLLAIAGCRSAPSTQSDLVNPRAGVAAFKPHQVESNSVFPDVKPSQTAPTPSGLKRASHQSDEDDEWTSKDAVPADASDSAMPLLDGDQFADLPTTESLTLDQFVAMAISNNPSIQQSAAKIDGARGQHLQAGLYPNPTIGYNGVNIGTAGTAGRQAGFVQQRFVTGGKLRLDQEIACREVQNREALFLAARQRVVTDVRSRFYEALIAQRRQKLTEELARIADDLAKSTQRLLDNELASENTLLQAEIEVEQTHILHDNAQNDARAAWRRLAVVAGEPDLPFATLEGEVNTRLFEHDVQSLAARVLADHPLLQAAQARVNRAAVAITRARREVVPDIHVIADAARTNQTDSNTARVQVGIEVPLFDKNQGNIATAEAELCAARAELRRIDLRLNDELTTVQRRYKNALQQANRYLKVILPKADQSLELVRNGYKQGQVEYLTLLNSQEKFVQASLAYLDSLEALQLAAALVEGQLLKDSFSTN